MKVISIPAELPEPEDIDIEATAEDYRSGRINLVCVLGPTASGKTRYAVKLAGQFGGEIISADSRQVYRGMDIGTGKDLGEYGEIPYHLIDIRPAGAQYNVYSFQRDFFQAYNDIRARGKVPILCGGTGLYINAVTRSYSFVERVPLSMPRGDAALPDCSTNITGSGLAVSSQDETDMSPCNNHIRPFFIGILVDRETRNARIDTRLDARLKEGMIQEIQGLLDSGVSEDVLISYGLEYKFVTLYIKGELSYDEMREKLAIAIHQFAKRQMTWFRGMERSGAVIHWVRP